MIKMDNIKIITFNHIKFIVQLYYSLVGCNSKTECVIIELYYVLHPLSPSLLQLYSKMMFMLLSYMEAIFCASVSWCVQIILQLKCTTTTQYSSICMHQYVLQITVIYVSIQSASGDNENDDNNQIKYYIRYLLPLEIDLYRLYGNHMHNNTDKSNKVQNTHIHELFDYIIKFIQSF